MMKTPRMWLLVSSVLLSLAVSHVKTKDCFPKGFKFGVATASYQIEGAWNESGKGESIWDHYTHEHPESIRDHSNGDVADDSYHHSRDDLRMLGELNVHFYRFSISWPRILPNGYSNEINEAGVRHYIEFIDALHNQGIEPVVTMYHWDMPLNMKELGGWSNPVMADFFVDYARVLFQKFGNKVKHWITFNEPASVCIEEAPNSYSHCLASYMCGHNLLRAHGMVYRMYEREFKQTGGAIGISLDFNWKEPATNSSGDVEAADSSIQFDFGWFAHPIFSTEGDYPQIMRQKIDEHSRNQNYPRSRLPRFTEEEVAMIRGSADFLGVNHYTSLMAMRIKDSVSSLAKYQDLDHVFLYPDPAWPVTNSSWVKVVPWGFRKALRWVKNSYNNPRVLVTENGLSTHPGLQDTKRISYIASYLRAMLDTITKDHCNVFGYAHWSLMDNFEWSNGYTERFGLYEVDYQSPERARTPRLSAHYYANIAKTGCMPDPSDYMEYKSSN